MHLLFPILFLLSSVSSPDGFMFENNTNDVFTPISKYIEKGDARSLSAWFADNFELSILDNQNDCSRSQGKLIMKEFFLKYKPHKFEIVHKTESSSMKYALGILSAGGQSFMVTILVKTHSKGNYIHHIKVRSNNATY